MSERWLELDAVSFSRGATTGAAEGEVFVVREVTARFEAGEVSLIRGETGAGKSTLLHIVAGILRPTSGEVRAEGEAVSRWLPAHRDRWRRRVGIGLQRPRLIDDLSALENVLVARLPQEKSLASAREAAWGALERLGVEGLAAERCGALSGGERQRVALARAVVNEPAYLLLDEPTSQQGDEGFELVTALIRAARGSGAVVVVASHDERLIAEDVIGAVYRLSEGRLRSEAP